MLEELNIVVMLNLLAGDGVGVQKRFDRAISGNGFVDNLLNIFGPDSGVEGALRFKDDQRTLFTESMAARFFERFHCEILHPARVKYFAEGLDNLHRAVGETPGTATDHHLLRIFRLAGKIFLLHLDQLLGIFYSHLTLPLPVS